MTHKLKTLLVSLSLLFSFAAPVAVTTSVYAADTPCADGATNCTNQNDINKKLKCGSNIDLSAATAKDNCNDNTADSGRDFGSLLRKTINVLSVLVGAIAVIMIIIGGFRYVTSAGSDSGVQSAKKTIMYALIGLVIVALAQVVVHFVLNNIT